MFLCRGLCRASDHSVNAVDDYLANSDASDGTKHVVRARAITVLKMPVRPTHRDLAEFVVDYEGFNPGYHAACQTSPAEVIAHLQAMRNLGIL